MKDKRNRYIMKTIATSEFDRGEFFEVLQKTMDKLVLENLDPEIDFSVNTIGDTVTEYNAIILGVKYV